MTDWKKVTWGWVCNECGSHEFTSAVSESDIHEYLACSGCGSDEFHREANRECGNCVDFCANSQTCGNPMVYLNHESNTHKTTSTTESCGFFRLKT
jgi:hypothetical protein